MLTRFVLVLLIAAVFASPAFSQHHKKQQKRPKKSPEFVQPTYNFFALRIGMTEDEALDLLRGQGAHLSVGLTTITSNPYEIAGNTGELSLTRGGTYASATIQTMEWTTPYSESAYHDVAALCYRRLGAPDVTDAMNEFSNDVTQWYLREEYNGYQRSVTVSLYQSFGKLCLVKRWNGH